MRRNHRFPVRILAALFLSTMFVSAADDTLTSRRIVAPETLTVQHGSPLQDPICQGRPLSHWLRIIRQRDEEMMPLAFDAIRTLGPDARAAVPELARFLTAPFPPIRVGEDSEDVIASKLNDILIRSDAIDTLVSIGDAAASATVSLVYWALVVRVMAPATGSRVDYEDFVDLMTIDVEQRLQVADAIVSFGGEATPAVERLLRVPDDEIRKFAVLILGAEAVRIGTDLLKSPECQDRKLGIAMLKDMHLIVAKEHLRGLAQSLVCDAD